MRNIIPTLLMLLMATPVFAHEQDDIRAVTSSGKHVLLKADHTWDFVEPEQGDPESSAVLTVTEVKEMQDACGLQFRLQNNLPFKIRNLVPRFSVFNQDNIMFDSASISFASIKPTKSQYTRIQFSGIGCHEISRIVLIDASRCRMSDIDQWNEEEGQCLGYIYMESSDLINISK